MTKDWGCKHTRTTRDAVYEYCEDCGAVRTLPKHGLDEHWHVCALCRLPKVAGKNTGIA